MTQSIPRWEKAVALKDGTRVTVRPLRPEDRAELRRAIEALSPETTMRRFFRVHVDPTDTVLDQLLAVDGRHHVAIAAFVPSPDLKEEHIAGVARFVELEGEPTTAEAAVTVLDAWQRHGLGRVLLTELVRSAHKCGIKKFRAEVLQNNEAVMAILALAGATKAADDGASATYDIVLEDAPTTGSHAYAFLRAVARSIRRAMEGAPPPQDPGAPSS